MKKVSTQRWCWLSTALLAFIAFSLAAPLDADARRRRRSRTSAKAKQRKQAKALFRKAQIQYNLGNFKRALAMYAKAYELLPLPAFLFNIGQCHREQGNHSKAIFFYEAYLRKGRTKPNRSIVENLIKQSKKLELRRREEEARRRREEARRRRIPPSRLRLATGDIQPGTEATVGGGIPAVTMKRVPAYKRWWFWTSIVAGVAAVVGTSLGIALSAKPRLVLPSGNMGTIDAR